MKTRPLSNTGVEIYDVDISNLTTIQIAEIVEIFFHELIVLIRGQTINPIPFAKLVSSFGVIKNLDQCVWNHLGQRISPIKTLDPSKWMKHLDEFPVQRVTGKKIKNEDSGIFGTGKLDWHSNINGVTWAPGIGLQAVSGVEYTHTSWMNSTKAYNDLTEDLKARCNSAIGHFTYAPEVWAEGLPEWQRLYMTNNKKFEYKAPIVNISQSGKKGLYFHYLNQCSIPNDPSLLEILKKHCFQKKYIFDLAWRIGDINLSHQVLTLHKRGEISPEILTRRILHRYAFDFSKTYPEYKPIYL